jgi:hypothetical protein
MNAVASACETNMERSKTISHDILEMPNMYIYSHKSFLTAIVRKDLVDVELDRRQPQENAIPLGSRSPITHIFQMNQTRHKSSICQEITNDLTKPQWMFCKAGEVIVMYKS